MRELVESISWEMKSVGNLFVTVTGAMTRELALSVAAHELTRAGYGDLDLVGNLYLGAREGDFLFHFKQARVSGE